MSYYVKYQFDNGPDMSSVLACFLGQFWCYTKQVFFLQKNFGVILNKFFFAEEFQMVYTS